MSCADRLLPLLAGVRRTGPARWIARCPAHDDKRPSLSVRETDDGRLLLHCWAGCDVGAIVGALGFDLADLFPPKAHPGAPRERRPWSAADLLDLAALEAGIVHVIASDVRQQRTISDADAERLGEAVARLGAMQAAAHASR
mgnify:CR=1 FL=1